MSTQDGETAKGGATAGDGQAAATKVPANAKVTAAGKGGAATKRRRPASRATSQPEPKAATRPVVSPEVSKAEPSKPEGRQKAAEAEPKLPAHALRAPASAFAAGVAAAPVCANAAAAEEAKTFADALAAGGQANLRAAAEAQEVLTKSVEHICVSMARHWQQALQSGFTAHVEALREPDWHRSASIRMSWLSGSVDQAASEMARLAELSLTLPDKAMEPYRHLVAGTTGRGGR